MTLLDIIQIWNYEHDNDLNDMGSIFEDIVLDERLDKDTLISVLLDECGAVQSVYNTTPTFKHFSDTFFKKYQWNITKLADTLYFEYDPLKNKNVEWTETTSIEQQLDTDEGTEESRTKDNTGTRSNQFEDTETNTISAMNSSTYEPDNQSSSSGSNTMTDNLKEEIAATKSRDKNENLTWEETDTHVESGNDGLVYQDLIKKEREIAQFSIYGWIAKKYKSELFLLVY